MWLARRDLSIADTDLARAGDHHLRACQVPPAVFRLQLAANAVDSQFRSDLDLLVTGGLGDYDVDRAATELILWSDRYLDPLCDARRSPSAMTRQQR